MSLGALSGSGLSHVRLFSPVQAGAKQPASDVAALLTSKTQGAGAAVTASGPAFSAASPQTAYEAQAIGQNQSAEAASGEKASASKKESAAEAFLKFAKMTPEQKIRAMFLASEGLTEEELAALPPKERQKIEDKIEKKIEDATKRGAGIDPT